MPPIGLKDFQLNDYCRKITTCVKIKGKTT